LGEEEAVQGEMAGHEEALFSVDQPETLVPEEAWRESRRHLNYALITFPSWTSFFFDRNSALLIK
jgi:hypothetical protein